MNQFLSYQRKFCSTTVHRDNLLQTRSTTLCNTCLCIVQSNFNCRLNFEVGVWNILLRSFKCEIFDWLTGRFPFDAKDGNMATNFFTSVYNNMYMAPHTFLMKYSNLLSASSDTDCSSNLWKTWKWIELNHSYDFNWDSWKYSFKIETA